MRDTRVTTTLMKDGQRVVGTKMDNPAYGKEFAKTGLLDPKFHRRLIVAERRRETGHYGEESSVTHEEALESFQWADEFIQVVKVFLRG